jgi:phospholipid-binding lipoprotein MlaA
MFQNKFILNSALLANLVVGGLLSGCASDPAEPAKDEWEGWNRSVHGFNDGLDKAVIKPVAKGYQEYVPEPVNQGVTNFFGNITDIGVTLNDLFQLKMLQSGMDLSRFLINTTAGVGGLFDVASKLDLPKHNEDFGQTLGFWGVPSGNYMVLPLIGPSSPRDAVGLLGDALLNPLTYISFGSSAAVGAAITGAKAVEVTDMRADLLSSEKIVDEAAVDRYDFIKNAYIQNREYLVYDGNPPEQSSDDIDLDEAIADSNKNEADANTVPDSTASSELPPVTQGAKDLGRLNDNSGPAPVVNHSRHLLELAPPE